MRCPKCSTERSLVTETRTLEGAIWRRRCCRGCGRNYVTQEVAAERMPSRDRKTSTDIRQPSQFKTDHLAGIWK